MSPQLQRGLLLFQQGRPELAEAELRQALAADPNEAYAHTLLALCLCQRGQFKDATAEAQQAIHLAPDFPMAHYGLAYVWHDRRHYDEALAAIHEALRLEPDHPDYCALLAQIQLDRRQWPAALEAAERGLQNDPEHVACTNLRAMALVKLGRKAEATATIEAALARDPDNSVTHANQGWAYLEQGNPQKALEHFREALRLEPTNEWARQGIIEALKARHLIYAVILKYFLWMARLSPQVQWIILLGGYFGNRWLGSFSQTHPEWAPWIWPLRILYITFALLTWTADPMFNLLLRLNRFGRLALDREQVVASNWIGGCVFLALASLGACLVWSFDSPFVLGAMVFGFLIIPLAGTFKCAAGWPRRAMAGYTLVMAALGLAALALAFLAGVQSPDLARGSQSLAMTCFLLFFLGAIGSGWVANILIMQRPRR